MMRTPPRCLLVILLGGLLLSTSAMAHEEEEHPSPPGHPHPHHSAIEVDASEGPTPWTSLDANSDPDHFHFVVVTDRTGGHREGVFEQGLAKTNLLQPEFVACVGDLIEGYTDDAQEVDAEWDAFESIIARLQMPFFYLPGNHDISNPMMARKWAQRFGPSYYHFIYRNVLFLCLNTEDGKPSNISDEQVAYAEQTLASNPDVRWTIVLMHKPLWIYDEGQEGHEQALRGRPYTVFAGHFHSYTKYNRHDQRYIILATTGGASQLRGTPYGEFDHVAWVTMTDDGPVIANLMLDGIVDENIRTEESAREVARLLDGFDVRFEPVYLESDTFCGGQATLIIANHTDQPVSLRGFFGHSNTTVPLPYTLALDAPAGQTLRVPIKLHVEKPTPAESIAPLPFDWSATFTRQDGQPLPVTGKLNFNVTHLHGIPQCDQPITVDGKFDDWPPLTFDMDHPGQVVQGGSWTGPADMSCRFSLAHDQTYLYAVVSVTDENLVSSPDAEPWKQDGVELRFDPRDDPKRAANRGRNDKDQFLISLSPAASPDRMAIHTGRPLPEGVKMVCVPTGTGYVAELAIPHAVLNQYRDQGEWSRLRFNLGVFDCDEEHGPVTKMWWQPEWRSDANIPASGTFTRSRELPQLGAP